MNDYDEGTYQRGYHDYLRKCAQDGTTAEITQASSFYNGYKYALQHALRQLDLQTSYAAENDQDITHLREVRMTLRKGIL